MTEPAALKAASWFIDQGFTVFPVWGARGKYCRCPLGRECDSPAKHPANKNGFLEATGDLEKVAKWLGNPGTPNYGVRAPDDGTIIIDLDGDLSAFPLDEIPDTLRVKSPNGEHVYLKWPAQPVPLHLFGKLVRSHAKGYVVGPGSVNTQGPYVRVPGAPLEVAEAPFHWLALADYGRGAKAKGLLAGKQLEFPGAVPQPVEQAPKRNSVITVEPAFEAYEVPTEIGEGGRYEAIRDYVASQYNFGHGHDRILQMAWAELSGIMDPPLTQREFESRFERTWEGIEERLGPPGAGKHREEPELEVTEETRSLITTVGDYVSLIPEKPPWVVEGYLYYGGVTLVAGAPKKGKSTLISDLLRARLNRAEFLNKPVAPGPVLYLTEEAGIAVAHKVRDLKTMSILDRSTALRAEVSRLKDVLALVTDWIGSRRDVVVVLDTLAIWAGFDDENNASEVTKAIARIMALAANTNAAVIIVHHTRKGGGTDGEAIRGSSAIMGTVDVSVEMKGVRDSDEGTRRQLDIKGRVIMPRTEHLDYVRPEDGHTVQAMAVNGGYHYQLVDLTKDDDQLREEWALGAPTTPGTAWSAREWMEHWDDIKSIPGAKKRLDDGPHKNWFARTQVQEMREGERARGWHWWMPARAGTTRGRVDDDE